MVPRLEPAGLFALALLSMHMGGGGRRGGGLLRGRAVAGHDRPLPRRGPARGSRRGGEAEAVARHGLCARGADRLGVWSALSALWSPAPDVAVADAQRVLIYALAFGLGIWLCNLLGARMQLSMVPLAFAALVAGLVTDRRPRSTATPPGNARARRDPRLPARLPQRERRVLRDRAVASARPRRPAASSTGACAALALAAAALCLELLPARARAAARSSPLRSPCSSTWSAPRDRAPIAALARRSRSLPALGIMPASIDLYRALNDERRRDRPRRVHAAGSPCRCGAGSRLRSAALAARFETRLRIGERLGRAHRQSRPSRRGRRRDGRRGVGSSSRSAIRSTWSASASSEFKSGGDARPRPAGDRASRLNAGSEPRRPLARRARRRRRRSAARRRRRRLSVQLPREREVVYQNAHDAHSVELETLAEFGVPGLILLPARSAAPRPAPSAPAGSGLRRPGSPRPRSPAAPTGWRTPRSTGSGPIRR